MPWTRQQCEAGCVDLAILGSSDGRLELEVSYLAWRNTFSIDLFGERGSLHLSGLRKWGPSELVYRERVLPSGVPREERETSVGADLTWGADLEHFEACAAAGRTSFDNDWWIAQVLSAAAG